MSTRTRAASAAATLLGRPPDEHRAHPDARAPCGIGQPAPLAATDSPTLTSTLVVTSTLQRKLSLCTVAANTSRVWTGGTETEILQVPYG